MANNAISAQGTLVYRAPASGAPTAFVVVAELRDITPPSLSRNPIETTSHNEAEESYVVGIKRYGELQMSLGFKPSLNSHGAASGLMYSWQQGSLDVWKVAFPDSSYWIFSGYVTNISPSAPTDDGLTADVSIRPTGGAIFA